MSPHCTTPARCLVCLGAAPRVVTIAGGQTLVDGAVADQPYLQRRVSAIRGGRSNQRNYAPKPAVRVRGARR